MLAEAGYPNGEGFPTTEILYNTSEGHRKIAVALQQMWKKHLNIDVTLLNQEKLNLSLTVYISIRTNQHNNTWAEEFRQVVSDLPQVLEVNRMSGDLDYLIKAVVPDMKGYDQLYKKLIKADLFDVSSSFVMEKMKQTTLLPLDHA